MPPGAPSGPDLAAVVADADAAGLPYVVIGGFSVIFHGYVRATRASDLLIPDHAESEDALARFLELVEARRFEDGRPVAIEEIADTDNARVDSRHGFIDLVRGGAPPLDFRTVADRAESVEWNGQKVRFASLSSLVGFKRLAGRLQDRLDLSELEAVRGELPVEPIPGLDD